MAAETVHQPQREEIVMHKAPGTIQRSKGIGGTDVAVLCGLSKYKTAYELYLEKRGEILKPDVDNELMRFGRRLEKPIADEFAFRSGRKVWRERKTLKHPVYKFALANIDRWQERDGEKGVYEGKNAGLFQRRIWLDGGVPTSYYLQLQHYLFVTGCRFGTFGVLFGGNEFHAFDVERDEDTIAQVLELESDFWQRVKDGNPPDFAFGEAGAALVKRMYAQAKAGTEHLFEGVEAEAKIRRLLQLKSIIKDREQQVEDLETWIKLQMGEAEFGLLPSVAKFSWKNGTRKSLDMDRLKQEHAELLVAYQQEKATRTFRITSLTEELGEMRPEDKEDTIVTTTGVRQIELE
jgi:putative phage-type endonuclease